MIAISAFIVYNQGMIELTSKHFNYEYLNIDSPSQEQFYKHLHNEYEILYFLNGDADYIIGATVYHLKKNDLLFIKPAMFHYLKPLSPATYERHVIHFSEKAVPKEILPALSSMHSIFNIKPDSTIDKIFSEITALLENSKNINEDAESITNQIKYSLKLVLIYLKNLPKTAKEKPSSTNVALSEILKFIDKNPEMQINAEYLSKKFFVSSSWITHNFRKILGISLKQYVNHKKILYAQKLISKGTKPTKVAEICSFDNYSTFYRLYKKYTQNLPIKDKN